jgi:hypothetical protein
MKLLDKVKKDLEKNKNYDFESDFWTDEILCVLYDAVYATKQAIKDEISINKKLQLEAENYAKKVNGEAGNELYPMCDETLNEITIKEFKAGYEFAHHSI